MHRPALAFLAVAAALSACSVARGESDTVQPHGAGTDAASPAGRTRPGIVATTTVHYPWRPEAHDSLDARFPAPPGFARAKVEAGGLPAFLRTLPLLPPGTAVVDYAGRELRAADDPRIAAVVDIDIGKRDLQQCADAVLRMNAEWRYGRGDRAIAYPVSSGAVLSYADFLAGQRAAIAGKNLVVRASAARIADDHGAFRAYLDEVFTWANTGSLERAGRPVRWADIQAGDFFVMPGKPFGHAVLVLDVARDGAGTPALLLGQSYMPAQSFHVLRSAPGGAWFVVPAGAVDVSTPFWEPFPLTSLRRLP